MRFKRIVSFFRKEYADAYADSRRKKLAGLREDSS